MPWNFKSTYSCDSVLSNCEGFGNFQISLRYSTCKSTLGCEEGITAQSRRFLKQIEVRSYTVVNNIAGSSCKERLET